MRTNVGVAWRSLICAGITVQGLDMRIADWPAEERPRERLLKLGATPIGGSPEEFDRLIRSEHEKWGPVIKAAGIKGE